MNLTGVFIGRPVMNTLVMPGIVLFGVAGYRAQSVSDLPNVDFSALQVNANLPGAAAEIMAANVGTEDLGLAGSMRRRGAPARIAAGVAPYARS